MASPDVQMASSHKPSVPRGQSQSLSLPLSPSLSLSLTHLLTRPRRWRWRGRGCAAFTMCTRAYSRCHCRAAVVGSGQLARMVTSSVPRSLAAGIAWHMPQLHPRLRLALRLQRWRSWRGRGCAAFTMCMRAYSRCHCRAAVVGSGQLARMVTSSVPRSLAAGIAWHMPQLHPRLRLALRLQRWRSWRGRGCGRSFYHVHESLQSMPLRLWPAQGSSHAW